MSHETAKEGDEIEKTGGGGGLLHERGFMDRKDENIKFIIPEPRRPAAQPGLEVSRFVENEHPTSPEVVVESSPFDGPGAAGDDSPEAARAATEAAASSAATAVPEEAAAPPSREPDLVPPLPPPKAAHPGANKLRRRPVPSSADSENLKDDLDDDEERLKLASAGGGGRRKTPGRILGLSVLRFWVVVGVLVFIVAVAIGVGVAIGVKTSHTYYYNVSTGTSYSTGVQGVSSPAPVNQYCPWENGTKIVPLDASGSPIVFNQEQPMTFQMHCNTYWPAAGPNRGTRDILVTYARDMYTCVTLCAEYNAAYSDAVGRSVAVGGGICVAAALIQGQGQGCHLQNGTGGGNDTEAAFGNTVDTAVLLGDWADLSPENLTAAFSS